FGRRTLPFAEAAAAFSGVALELAPTAQFRPRGRSERTGWLRMLGRPPGLTGPLVLALSLTLAMGAACLAAPLLVRWIADEAVLAGDRELVISLTIASLALAAL